MVCTRAYSDSDEARAKNPGAKAAVDKEWKKLEDKTAWLVETIMEKEGVIKRAKATGKTISDLSWIDARKT